MFKNIISGVMFLVSGLAGIYGFVIMQSAKSALHEQEALILFLIATVALGFCGVLNTPMPKEEKVVEE